MSKLMFFAELLVGVVDVKSDLKIVFQLPNKPRLDGFPPSFCASFCDTQESTRKKTITMKPNHLRMFKNRVLDCEYSSEHTVARDQIRKGFYIVGSYRVLFVFKCP